MEIYHVLNRSVEQRNIFSNKKDFLRFIHDLFEFNDEKPAHNIYHRLSRRTSPQYIDVGRHYIAKSKRKLLVELLAFCLMPNHYHLLVKPRSKEALPLFMKKLNGGYTKYFNIKYKRTGVLFQGKYKRILISQEPHFIHLPYYIHCNPLDLIMPEWRKREIPNHQKAFNFLMQYRWSSLLDYLGEKNFPSVTQRDFLTEYMGGEEMHKKELIRWLKHIETAPLQDLTLE